MVQKRPAQGGTERPFRCLESFGFQTCQFFWWYWNRSRKKKYQIRFQNLLASKKVSDSVYFFLLQIQYRKKFWFRFQKKLVLEKNCFLFRSDFGFSSHSVAFTQEGQQIATVKRNLRYLLQGGKYSFQCG